MSRCAGLRRMGAASLDLAWLAAGRFDGFWERNLQAWNMAAGIIMVKEAGGFVTGLGGKPNMLTSGGIVAGNETIQRTLRKTLDECAAAA